MTSPKDDLPTETHWQARLPFFFGWVIVAIVFMQAFSTAGALWSTAILSVPMKEDLGWSQSAIFAGITLRTLGASIGGFFLGKYLDSRRGAPTLAVVSGLVSGIGLMLVALVDSQWQFWLIFGVLSGLFGAGPGALLQAAIVPKWFVRKRFRAAVLASMGTGFAAMTLPLIVPPFVEAFEWRATFVTMGVFTIILAVLPAFLLRTRPEDVGLQTDGDTDTEESATRASRVPEQSLTAKEAFRTTTLWLLVGAAFFGGFSPTAYPTNLVPTFVDRDFSLQVAGWAFAAYGFTSFTGRFFWGWLADKTHIRHTLMIIAVYTGLTVPLLQILPDNASLAAGAITGFGIGGWVGLSQAVWAAYFGRGNLGSIIGKVRPLITISSGTGPLLVAGMADLFGGFGVGIMVMALSWWICSGFLFLVRPAKAMEQPAEPQPAP
ncbi:MAG: MFS transporter, partial [Chloroflexi bacterium]|nr:MFS transporter [Chloroflexota bacterium]